MADIINFPARGLNRMRLARAKRTALAALDRIQAEDRAAAYAASQKPQFPGGIDDLPWQDL